MQMYHAVVYSACTARERLNIFSLRMASLHYCLYCIVILFYYYDSIIYGSVAVHVERVDNNNWMFYINIYVVVVVISISISTSCFVFCTCTVQEPQAVGN